MIIGTVAALATTGSWTRSGATSSRVDDRATTGRRAQQARRRQGRPDRGDARNEETPDEGPRGILGGQGNDTIYVSDGERDTVGCGGGTAYFDRGVDRFIDNGSCENRVPR
jgi:hypothetical protein